MFVKVVCLNCELLGSNVFNWIQLNIDRKIDNMQNMQTEIKNPQRLIDMIAIHAAPVEGCYAKQQMET